jgi:integrase
MIEAKLSRTYINGLLGIIKRAFRWAVAQELLPADAYQRLAAVSGLKAGRSSARETMPEQAVEDNVFQATLGHLPPMLADMAKLERATGCRPGELVIMRPCDIDRNKPVWIYRPAHHKMTWRGKDRRIFIGTDVQPILAKYLLRAPETFCFCPAESRKQQRQARSAARKIPLSCGNRSGSNVKRKPRRAPGERYSTRSYSKAIRRAAEKAGVERWSANRLRHAAAREIQEHYGLEHAAAVLGNTVPVAARYAGFNFSLAEQTVAERAAAIGACGEASKAG